MRLSIVIPSCNMAAKIDQCLDSIFESGADKKQYEVIIVDSSTDGSMEKFKEHGQKQCNMKVIHSHRHLNIGPARNIAVQQAVGDYVLCMDIDDKMATSESLPKLLDGLDGKDIYSCSYFSRRDQKAITLHPESLGQLASCPVACWTKVYRRELYVPFPNYMPEDVLAHYLLVDKCKSFGCFDFTVVDYDNTTENKGAMSRTFDWLLAHPSNLMQLANTGLLAKLELKEEFVAGVIHNLADMWQCRDKVKNEEVKKAYMKKLNREYQNFMSGYYIH